MTVERIIGAFDAGGQHAIRSRLAATSRFFVSQRLLPKKALGDEETGGCGQTAADGVLPAGVKWHR